MASLFYGIQRKLNQLTSYIPPPPPGARPEQPRRKILLVHAHPVYDSSFSAAIANAFETSAVEAGHEVKRVNLYNHDNPLKCYRPNLSKKERLSYFNHITEPDESILEAQVKSHLDLLRWCDTLVLCYPTWWMNVPASLKGFFDRTLVSGFTWEFPSNCSQGKIGGASLGLVPRLTNIERIVGVSTYGASRLIVTAAGDNGRRMIANAVRHSVCPAATVTWLGLYHCDEVKEEQRTAFLDQVKQLPKNL